MSVDHTPWDAQQREWLQALGHEVWVLGAAAPREAAPTPDSVVAPVAAPATVRRERAVPAAPRVPPPAPSLLDALARAAGRPRDDAELLRLLPPLASLHGNPAARRALWPHLRALRRRPPG